MSEELFEVLTNLEEAVALGAKVLWCCNANGGNNLPLKINDARLIDCDRFNELSKAAAEWLTKRTITMPDGRRFKPV